MAVAVSNDSVGGNFLSRPPKRSIDHAFSASAFTEVGGARVGWASATYPLARITCDDEWLCIRVVLSRPLWIARNEVWQVRRLSQRRRSRILFDNRTGLFDSVAWYSWAPDRVLGALARAGWPVQPPSGPRYLKPS